jgi:hypothetical protein
MTNKLGDCIGPMGAVIHHEKCPGRKHTVDLSRPEGHPQRYGWLVCGCWCHQEES